MFSFLIFEQIGVNILNFIPINVYLCVNWSLIAVVAVCDQEMSPLSNSLGTQSFFQQTSLLLLFFLYGGLCKQDVSRMESHNWDWE